MEKVIRILISNWMDQNCNYRESVWCVTLIPETAKDLLIVVQGCNPISDPEH